MSSPSLDCQTVPVFLVYRWSPSCNIFRVTTVSICLLPSPLLLVRWMTVLVRIKLMSSLFDFSVMWLAVVLTSNLAEESYVLLQVPTYMHTLFYVSIPSESLFVSKVQHMLDNLEAAQILYLVPSSLQHQHHNHQWLTASDTPDSIHPARNSV